MGCCSATIRSMEIITGRTDSPEAQELMAKLIGATVVSAELNPDGLHLGFDIGVLIVVNPRAGTLSILVRAEAESGSEAVH